MHRPFARSERGQVLPLFALMLVVLLLAAGTRGGRGLGPESAADCAEYGRLRRPGRHACPRRVLTRTSPPAPAPTRMSPTQSTPFWPRTTRSLSVRPTLIAPVCRSASVGGGGIPTGAAGVVVNAKTSWKPFFLGIIGVSQWSAGTTAERGRRHKRWRPAGSCPSGSRGHRLRVAPVLRPEHLQGFDACLRASTS